MDPTAIGDVRVHGNSMDVALNSVMATTASNAPLLQPNTLEDAQSTAHAHRAESLVRAAASLTPGAMPVSTSVTDVLSGESAPPAHQPDILYPLPSLDKHQLLDQCQWPGTSELLPPARLVEVAHAALQSSGFRRRVGSGSQQNAQHDPPQLQSEGAGGAGMVGGPMKRERQQFDEDIPFGLKRLCSESDITGAELELPVRSLPNTRSITIDAVARITSSAPASASAAQQPPPLFPASAAPAPLPPQVTRDSAASNVTSSLARPQPRRFSNKGSADSADAAVAASTSTVAAVATFRSAFAAAATAAPPGPPGQLLNGPLKSAFHVAPLMTEWQPGCAVTTGRRSARSSAPLGSRSLTNIARVPSVDAAISGPLPRRGSGYLAGAVAAAATATAATAIAADGGVVLPGESKSCSVSPCAPAAAAATIPQPAASGAAVAAAAAAIAASASGLEAALSADLRRLAQLAEAAAMLEEQLATEEGASGDGEPGGAPHLPGQATSAEGWTGGQAAAASSHRDHEGGRAAATAAAGAGVDPPSLRHRAGSLAAGGLPLPLSGKAVSSAAAGGSGSAGCGAAGGRDRDRDATGAPPPPSPPSSQPLAAAPGAANSAPLRSLGSMALVGRVGTAESQHRGVGGRSAVREGSPSAGGGGADGGGGEEEGTAGSRLPCGQEADDDSGGGTRRNGYHDHHSGGVVDGELEDGDVDEELREGSNDCGGAGSPMGGVGAGGRTLTERYRAALKASAAQQRGRALGNGGSKFDSDKSSRSLRNGVCARIASITKERLQQVYHLNIEEAARELGIGMTKLKEHCRTLGIPRWPSRKLKSMDKLIESLNERAMTEPATKEVIADILAEIEQFKRAIYENPCLEVEEDIKRLRQSNFKKEYQQRQVEQRMRLGSADRPSPSCGSGGGGAGGGGGGGRASSAGPAAGPGASAPLPPLPSQPGSLRESTSGGLSSSASAAAAAATAALAAQSGLPLVPGLVPSAGAAASTAAVAASASSGAPAPPPLSLPQALLNPGLQHLLIASQPGLQHLMVLGNMPPSPALLLPPVLQGAAQQSPQPLAAAKPLPALGDGAGGFTVAAAAAAAPAAAAAGGGDGGGVVV